MSTGTVEIEGQTYTGEEVRRIFLMHNNRVALIGDNLALKESLIEARGESEAHKMQLSHVDAQLDVRALGEYGTRAQKIGFLIRTARIAETTPDPPKPGYVGNRPPAAQDNP